jgi:CheY-like chemotaxis protein
MGDDRTAHQHTLLIVEDDSDTREAFVALASSVGLDAIEVDNGREALALLRGGLRPCLIVLDMAMPVMDGFAFRREQIADPALADIPVVVTTGGGWVVQADARAVGLTLFLHKPVDPVELLRAFDEHCGAPGDVRDP